MLIAAYGNHKFSFIGIVTVNACLVVTNTQYARSERRACGAYFPLVSRVSISLVNIAYYIRMIPTVSEL